MLLFKCAKHTLILTLLGAIPFLAFIVCYEATNIPKYQDIFLEMFLCYGIIIAVFMHGSHWGIHIGRHKSTSLLLPLSATGITLVLFIAKIFIKDHVVMLAMLFASFSILLMVDYKLYQEAVIMRTYFLLRCIITALVLSSIITLGWLLCING